MYFFFSAVLMCAQSILFAVAGGAAEGAAMGGAASAATATAVPARESDKHANETREAIFMVFGSSNW
jgi:hypothetical protein